MMSIKKAIKWTAIAATAMLIFSGCVNSQYNSDENVKRSIVILIQKVERLESLHGVKSSKAKSIYKTNSPVLTPVGPMTRTLKRDILIFSKRKEKSKIIATIKAGTVVEISACDKYGWCTLKGQKGFVKRWKILN